VSLLAIDPGTEQSGFVVLEAGAVRHAGVLDNEQLLRMLRTSDRKSTRLNSSH
jgi:hypothetical protein